MLFGRLAKTSTTFRLALSFMAVFAISFLILGSFIFFQIVSFLESEFETSIDTVISEITEVFRAGGIESVKNELETRIASDPSGLYLLVDSECVPIGGSLKRLEPYELDDEHCESRMDGEDWFFIEPHEEISDSERGDLADNVFARLVPLSTGVSLIHGRTVDEAGILLEDVRGTLALGFLLMLTLTVGGSLLMSRRVAGRLGQRRRPRPGGGCDRWRRHGVE